MKTATRSVRRAARKKASAVGRQPAAKAQLPVALSTADCLLPTLRLPSPLAFRRSPLIKPRGGFALLVCMMIAAVSAVSALGIYRTLEVEAQQNKAVAEFAAGRRAAMSCCEYAVARLINDPNLRGIVPVAIPGHPPGSCSITAVSGGNLQLVATATTGGTVHAYRYTLRSSELSRTRTEMRLQN